jgi:hypothetical protein
MLRTNALRGAAVIAALLGTTSATADETTFCNAFITSLPYTITVQGHYCFNRNLSTTITTGAAIRINADFVVLDLNNFKLGGGGAGPATQAVGILALNRSNITGSRRASGSRPTRWIPTRPGTTSSRTTPSTPTWWTASTSGAWGTSCGTTS